MGSCTLLTLWDSECGGSAPHAWMVPKRCLKVKWQMSHLKTPPHTNLSPLMNILHPTCHCRRCCSCSILSGPSFQMKYNKWTSGRRGAHAGCCGLMVLFFWFSLAYVKRRCLHCPATASSDAEKEPCTGTAGINAFCTPTHANLSRVLGLDETHLLTSHRFSWCQL